jgi:hypothetical protein
MIVLKLINDDMQIIHGLVDRVMEKNGINFVSPGDKSGYYIERSDVSVYYYTGSICVLFCPLFWLGTLVLLLTTNL